MRLCRFMHAGTLHVGIYADESVLPLAGVVARYESEVGRRLSLPVTPHLLDLLPPAGLYAADTFALSTWVQQQPAAALAAITLRHNSVEFLPPISSPSKIFLLAGNYAKHVEERGRQVAERQETFPYVFMKPPSTTLVGSGTKVALPAPSPNHIDWEMELAVVIGQRVKGIKEAQALSAVAGYTIINDLSDRSFRPNPQRKQRDRDEFFDWLHGKWHDGFCPCGPCIVSAAAVADPQQLGMKLRLNGQVRQDATTAQQIFPVAAVIEFIASFVTLEPGDLISTGTPAGVGSASGTYLKPGDVLEASIESIGTLVTHIVAPAE